MVFRNINNFQKYIFLKNLHVTVLEYYIVMLPWNLKVYIPGTFVTVLCTVGYLSPISFYFIFCSIQKNKKKNALNHCS